MNNSEKIIDFLRECVKEDNKGYLREADVYWFGRLSRSKEIYKKILHILDE